MRTNDLKKDTKILLNNGWKAELKDNKRGNIRLAKVYGLYTELGSIYSHDIIGYFKDDKLFTNLEYTKSQLHCKKINKLLLGE